MKKREQEVRFDSRVALTPEECLLLRWELIREDIITPTDKQEIIDSKDKPLCRNKRFSSSSSRRGH
jgi:hypothetical protein